MDRRRSTRLHPQIQASEEGSGVTRRRSPRLHPQSHANEDGAGVTPCRRRSPRLHPQSLANEDGAGVTRRRRGTSPPPDSSLPDDDDMLWEILLRLPPQPSSLPRASAVCKRWRGIVTDPKFHRQFCAHHRKPPLLGVFEHSEHQGIVFSPILDPPDRIPPQRFSLGRRGYYLLDCRHGRVLVKDMARKEVIVCDPITGQQCRLAVPPDLGTYFLHGAVVCAVGDHDHVQGGCHSSPFKVVLLSVHEKDYRSFACVYCSDTGLWGNTISVEALCEVIGKSPVLVGNCVHWSSIRDVIVKFDLDEHSLTVITGPPDADNFDYDNRQIIDAEDGTLGFAVLDYPYFRMWQRKVNGNAVATWVPWRTVEIHSILQLPPQIEGQGGGLKTIRGYHEETGVIFIYVEPNIYMVQLNSRQSKRLPETWYFAYYHPFTSFYTPGTIIEGGSNGAEILHNTLNDCSCLM